jgi:succinate dehydrogenase / fumarate reductase cytochrome b subunit
LLEESLDVDGPAPPFLVRHEFAIRRLHSLSGLVPVGAYMVVHLVTNASVLNSPGSFQSNVYTIHSLGKLLPIVEWGFIFLPILFHAIVGVAIAVGMVPNTRDYPYAANRRYTAQRWTGMIAFAFIMWHVFHMHGWFHFDPWLTNVAEPYGGARFRPYNAASSAGLAMQHAVVLILYAVGVLAWVYHLANGLWTMGITWGVWTSEAAQRRALVVCSVFGWLLAVVSVGALYGMWNTGRGAALERAVDVENRMYESRVGTGQIEPDPHKRSHEQSDDPSTLE